MPGFLPQRDLVSRVLGEISTGNVALVRRMDLPSPVGWDAASVTKHLGVRMEYYHRKGELGLIFVDKRI